MNPFALSGPDFLTFYAILLAGAIVAAAIVRHALRQPSDNPGVMQLDPYQTAYLAAGARGATEAAIVALTARGALQVMPGARFAAVETQPTWLHPVEQAVYSAAGASAGAAGAFGPAGAIGPGAAWLVGRLQQAAAQPGLTPAQAASLQRVDNLLRSAAPRPVAGATVPALRAGAQPAVAEVRDQLRRVGLVMLPAQVAGVRLLPALIVALAGAIGGVRLWLGVQAGHPVAYLTGLLVLAAIVALAFVLRSSRRSRRGGRALAATRRSYAALRHSAAAAGATLAAADLGLAVGLWGPTVLRGGQLDGLRSVLRPSGGGADGGDGGGDGGGGGCGGGCGGGGCGG